MEDSEVKIESKSLSERKIGNKLELPSLNKIEEILVFDLFFSM